MSQTRFHLRFSSGFVIPLVVMACMSDALPSRAGPQTAANASAESEVRVMLNASDLPDRGTPPARRGTGSRGNCLSQSNRPALTNLVGDKGLNQTVSDRPTFWVYVPYPADEGLSGEFSVQDGEQDVYRTDLRLPPTPGIVSITLPQTTAPLQIGKAYRWYFEINCPGSRTTRNPKSTSVTGIVRRVDRSIALDQELAIAKTPLQRAASFAKHGVWFDTLTEIAQWRLDQPQSGAAQRAWTDLLSDRAIGLQWIADKALVGRVTTSSQPE